MISGSRRDASWLESSWKEPLTFAGKSNEDLAGLSPSHIHRELPAPRPPLTADTRVPNACLTATVSVGQ